MRHRSKYSTDFLIFNYIGETDDYRSKSISELTQPKESAATVGLGSDAMARKEQAIRNLEQQSKEHTMSIFNRFMNDESGATAIEYSLIAALVSVAIITVLGTVGTELTNVFTKIGNSLKTAAK
jgi:pilus assembly protein Flp/PilA